MKLILTQIHEISVKTRPNQFNHEVCEPLAQTNWKKVQIGVKAVGNILQSTQCLITFLRIYQLLTLHLTFKPCTPDFNSNPVRIELTHLISRITHLIYQNWSDNLLGNSFHTFIRHLNTLFWDVEVVGHKQYFLHTLTPSPWCSCPIISRFNCQLA